MITSRSSLSIVLRFSRFLMFSVMNVLCEPVSKRICACEHWNPWPIAVVLAECIRILFCCRSSNCVVPTWVVPTWVLSAWVFFSL